MAGSVNKVIIIGNLGRDPEVRNFQNGGKVVNLRIATSESWKDKQTGEQQERTEWHRVKFFGRLAEIAGEYLKKGSQVYVEGKLRTDEYEKDGIKRYSTDIIADEMQMLGSRGGEGGGGGGGSGYSRDRGSERSAPSRGAAPSAPRQSAPPADSGFEDDDIPF